MLQVKPIKTRIYRSNESLENFLIDNLENVLVDGQVLAVTSKLISLTENRFVSKNSITKEELIKREADTYLGACAYDCHLTIKENLLIPSAGIDESNSESGDYILYPKNSFESARRIQRFLKKTFKLKSLGVILTDSHTTPLRRGVTGVALSYYGFNGVLDQIGSKDLFNREMKMTQINIADALAVSATLVMGEGSESRPLAIVDYPVEFIDLPNNEEIKIPIEEDIYYPLLGNLL